MALPSGPVPIPAPDDYPPLAAFLADLDKLDRAIGSGVLTVDSHTQGRVTYRSMADMMRARAFLVGQIASLRATPRTRRVVVTNRSGW